ECDVHRRAFARARQQLRLDVDADHLSHMRRERERECACARADIERALVAAGLDELEHLRGELGRARILPRSDEIGCARKPAHETTTRRARAGSLLIPVMSSYVIVATTRACSSARTPRPI